MADKTADIRQEIAEARQDIARSRSAITEKLALLEDRVQETVDGVKHTFDVHYQVRQRPWVMLGGSLLAGYMLGRRGGVTTSITRTSSESSSRPAMAAGAHNHFRSGVASIKTAVFGAVISVLWTMANQALLPPASRNTRSRNPMPISASEANGGRAL